MAEFRVALDDRPPTVYVGEALLVNAGYARVSVSVDERGRVQVNVIEEDEGTVRSIVVGAMGFEDG